MAFVHNTWQLILPHILAVPIVLPLNSSHSSILGSSIYLPAPFPGAISTICVTEAEISRAPTTYILNKATLRTKSHPLSTKSLWLSQQAMRSTDDWTFITYHNTFPGIYASLIRLLYGYFQTSFCSILTTVCF